MAELREKCYYSYHHGFSSDEMKEWLDDSKIAIVVTGGSSVRIEQFATMLSNSLILPMQDIGSKERYTSILVGKNIICSNHGMGRDSCRIFMKEILEVLERCNLEKVYIMRIGTSGGISVEAGSIVLCSKGVDQFYDEKTQQYSEEYREYSAAKRKTITASSDYDTTTNKKIMKIAKDFNVKLEYGKTLSCECFFEGQGRIDDDRIFTTTKITEEEKMQFLRSLEAQGIKNIEMESTVIPGPCNIANLILGYDKYIAICMNPVIVKRLKGDQITITIGEKINMMKNAETLLREFIRNEVIA